MGKAIDLTGKRFGFWIALEKAGKNKNGQTQWLCRCECNGEKIVTTNSLRSGNSTSCGCNHKPNLINEVFGELTVINQDSEKGASRRYWKCKCNCGNIISASTYQLRNKKVDVCDNHKKTINDNEGRQFQTITLQQDKLKVITANTVNIYIQPCCSNNQMI